MKTNAIKVNIAMEITLNMHVKEETTDTVMEDEDISYCSDVKVECEEIIDCTPNIKEELKISNKLLIYPLNDTVILNNYCQNCKENYDYYCLNCPTLLRILDYKYKKKSKVTPKKTLPNNLFEIKKLNNHEAVFTLKVLPEGVILGPYLGLDFIVNSTGLSIYKFRNGKLRHTKGSKRSNWLRYINICNSMNEANLVAFQWKSKLFYQTKRRIDEGEELLVYLNDKIHNSLKMLNVEENFVPNVQKLENVYPCTPCCLGFNAEIYLEEHHVNCPSEIKRSRMLPMDIKTIEYQCPLCNYSTKWKGNLKTHSLVHADNKEIYRCSKCTYQTNWKGNLKQHFVIHDNLNLTYKCSQCSYRTRWKGNLKQHLPRHKIGQSYQCSYCTYQTSWKGNLKKHTSIHSKGIDDKSIYPRRWRRNSKSIDVGDLHQCSKCAYRTRWKGNLKQHFSARHEEMEMFQCSQCPYKTRWKGNLRQHFNVHNKNQRLYKCVRNKLEE